MHTIAAGAMATNAKADVRCGVKSPGGAYEIVAREPVAIIALDMGDGHNSRFPHKMLPEIMARCML